MVAMEPFTADEVPETPLLSQVVISTGANDAADRNSTTFAIGITATAPLTATKLPLAIGQRKIRRAPTATTAFGHTEIPLAVFGCNQWEDFQDYEAAAHARSSRPTHDFDAQPPLLRTVAVREELLDVTTRHSFHFVITAAVDGAPPSRPYMTKRPKPRWHCGQRE